MYNAGKYINVIVTCFKIFFSDYILICLFSFNMFIK